MIARALEPAPTPDPEIALERATARLDAALLEIGRLIGVNGMTARVAGRMVVASTILLGPAP